MEQEWFYKKGGGKKKSIKMKDKKLSKRQKKPKRTKRTKRTKRSKRTKRTKRNQSNINKYQMEGGMLSWFWNLLSWISGGSTREERDKLLDAINKADGYPRIPSESEQEMIDHENKVNAQRHAEMEARRWQEEQEQRARAVALGLHPSGYGVLKGDSGRR